MARKQKTPVKLDPKAYATIKREAARQGVPMAAVVNQMVEVWAAGRKTRSR